MAKFTHLHVHSHYSLLDGLPKIDELILAAKRNGMDALALTDHGVMYGAIEFYKKAKAAGIKPIIGQEAYVAPYGYQERTRQEDKVRRHITLLAKNYEGYKNLLLLTTKAHLEGFYYKPRIDKELLKQYAKGLIGLSGCMNGEISRLLLQNNIAQGKKLALEYQDIFGKGNFYLELQRHPRLKDQETVNRGLQEISQNTHIPMAASADSHYLKPDDQKAQETLVAINTNKDLADENRLSMKECDLSFSSTEHMEALFHDVPAALENTQKITEACNLEIPLGELKLPTFPVEDTSNIDEFLRSLCEKGLQKRYQKVGPEIRKRLSYELSVIRKTGFASYFLIVWDIVNWAKSQGIIVGPGRGSAAGSLVSYLLNITNIDPLAHRLLFERFLNPERISPPDIDIDFADTRRDEVIHYAKKRYGDDHVAQIITFGTLASRVGIRDVGRTLGHPYIFCDRLAKMIPFGMELNQCLEEISEFRKLYDVDPKAREVIDLSRKLEGVARHASTHACGLVITPEVLTAYTPLQYASQDDRTIVTQYEMHSIEDLGLLKMDFLGLKNLTIIEDTLTIVKERTNEKLDIEYIPLDDKKTFELLREAHTKGIFQLECLTGETLISNTTIKKLYEKKHKKVLRSLYIDEGKVHENQILEIISRGEKEVYTLIAENNWCIKATKDHYFLTERGWKKLGDIMPGERVLMKARAKHLIYNTCGTCTKQINGQRGGKSNFCYKCSATFYKNPSKNYTRKKIKEAMIRFYQTGGKPWNYAITKEQSEILRHTGEKISKALRGRPLEELWGKERLEKFRIFMSQRMRGKGNPMYRHRSPHRKGGFRKDLGHYVRSSWEADFARVLKLHNIEYKYEPRIFRLQTPQGNYLHYTPDFYVPSQNTFYEIKGWMHPLDEEKIRLFHHQYPHYELIVISATKFAELALRYQSLINWECPRLPLDQSLYFISVKNIIYSGIEKTYDIAMASPGNNFVANGFIVHNSEGMQRHLKELEPSQFNDIVAMISLYRPGPMELIPTYIARKKGIQPVSYLHPKMEPALKSTYGIMIYQEQLMQIAQDLAGLSLAQADILRKAVGKKIRSLLEEQKTKLIEGMKKNGISASIADEAWKLIEPFDRYGFNLSHACGYALVSYQTAYLKAHYPLEFMTALLNSRQGDIERLAPFIEEARRMGIRVLPPEINESLVNFTPVGENTIRFGLKAIKNVGGAVIMLVIEERLANGPFRSIMEFLERVRMQSLNKKLLESLIKSGAFDSLNQRNTLLENLDLILRMSQEMKAYSKRQQSSLFGTALSPTLQLKQASPATLQQHLAWEKEFLGLYISGDPLEKHRTLFEQKFTPLAQLDAKFSNREVLMGGSIEAVKRITTRNGTPMLFVKVKDHTRTVEVTLFPRTVEEYGNMFREGNILAIQGRVEMREGALTIICKKAKTLN